MKNALFPKVVKNFAVVSMAVSMLVACGASSSSVKKEARDYMNPNISYGEITDERDGLVYKSVKIGEQEWMAENLKYDYNNGTAKSWCYDNNPENCKLNGRLYTWSAAMDSAAVFSEGGKDCGYEAECSASEPVRGVCPEGWHLPSEKEWQTLFDAVGGGGTACTNLKAARGWRKNGTNSYGFTALPAGFYSNYMEPGFYAMGYNAHFWSSTEKDIGGAYAMSLFYYKEDADLSSDSKNSLISVRCLKDN